MRSLLLMLLFLVLMTTGSAEQIAPVNPKFIQWQEKQKIKSELVVDKSGVQKHATGWCPSPLPEKVFKSGMYKSKRTALPGKFDLSDPNLDGNRNDSQLTPVTDQDTCGACWAFATYGAHEGALKIDGLGTHDFSEQHLSYNNGTEWASDPCSGGNLQMSMAYLARGSGPVREADDPFSIGGSSNAAATRDRYMDNIIELPIRDPADKMNAGWFAMIKEALYTTQKPLYVSMQVDGGSAGETGASVWENASKSFYCSKTIEECESNHAVVIVGWDDTYAAQGQTGAFIIRNSWGLTWNNVTDGYYYVPYTDNSLAMDGSVAYFEDVDDAAFNVTKIYQHDELPASYEYGSNGNARWAANKYTITANESIIGVGFQALYPDTEYEIKFFTASSGADPSVRFSSPIGSTITGQIPVAFGWHTVVLDDPLEVLNGQTIIVQIKLRNPTTYSIPVEADIAGYVNAESSYAESYYSSDGINFSDIKTLF
ncbi:MAG: hypothetical protein JXK05_00310 [Campylobacterales bacterium]|nr:hypothetical protein [Campylobacterales bacterium]